VNSANVSVLDIFAPVDPLFGAYLSFTALLVLTPGATTAVVVRNALMGGRHAGLAAATGAALGNTSHALLAGLGLAVIFARWPAAMTTLRVAGGAYLGWLGGRSLYRGLRHHDGGLRLLPSSPPATDARQGHAGSLRQGLTANLLNPAIATFYLVVVPTFIPHGASRGYFVLLAAVHVGFAFVCHGVWALALDRIRAIFNAPLARRTLETATGLALIALAIRVLAN
jgi:threonine/homoserine/homoserine lactone efflux protein